jgi:hypothetical protein
VREDRKGIKRFLVPLWTRFLYNRQAHG